MAQMQQKLMKSDSGESIFRLPPYYYMHVLDLNTNVTRVELGPKTFIRQDNERVVKSPESMIIVPPRHYCILQNPAIRDADGNVQLDTMGQVRLSHADLEIKQAQDPFPLYPGEELHTKPTPLKVVPANSALRLRATLDFDDAAGEKKIAGDEWLFEGPGTYIPRKEVSIEETVRATIIRPNQALKLRARRDTKDRDGNMRVTGEEWLVKKVGSYLPGAYEEVIETVDAFVLTEKKALHVRALRTFKDTFGVVRKNGEEWLVKMTDSETYIPGVYEEVVGEVNITTLNNRQYAVILNPLGEDGKPQLGHRKLVKGDKSFFLQPGESLEQGIQDVYVLDENQGIILRANEAFTDSEMKIDRQPGDRWMIRGPTEYVPPVMVEVVTMRSTIPLDENEGIYVRDIKTGKVRAIIGETYMLTQDEVLWEKPLPARVEELLFGKNSDTSGGLPAFQSLTRTDNMAQGDPWMCTTEHSFGLTNMMVPPVQQQQQILQPKKLNMKPSKMAQQNRNDEAMWSKELPPAVESLLASNKDPLADRSDRRQEVDDGRPKKRDKTKVVTFRVPHNAAVQVYDYKDKKARVVFGPALVMLGPDEHFTQLSLSGGKPKRPNVIKNLCLLLGPDFCTDIIIVETADHARLQLQLSYNWYFDTADRSDSVAAKLFSVPDFVGDACKAIASRVRGMVAQVQFDNFHKNSARIIRTAVFGQDEHNKVRDQFAFTQNNLVVTSIDIQSVEPVDQRTRDSLQKSVTLAIEITTNSQEAAAKHEAERLEQEARGKLERQKINDESASEIARKELLELQANSSAVESTGQAKAEASSRAEAARIEGEAAVEQARLKAEASKIETESELSRLSQAREAELKYLNEKNMLEIRKAQEIAALETKKFQDTVSSLGAQTIQAIATSGPEMQVKLLQGLGLSTALITDGSSPINLFQTAQGLIGGAMGGGGQGLMYHHKKHQTSAEDED